MTKIKTDPFSGWALNEGGRVVLEYLKRKDKFGAWRLRLFVFGVNLSVGWKSVT